LTAANRAVQLELSRKLAELDERYAMTAAVTPVIVVSTKTPVLAVDVVVLRKQSKRTHRIYWNPLIKQFEPLLCSRCHQATFAAAFTNDTVEPLCGACYASPIERAPSQSTQG
jgi:hypothetical protein